MKCFPFREKVFQSKTYSHHVDTLEFNLIHDFEGKNIEP